MVIFINKNIQKKQNFLFFHGLLLSFFYIFVFVYMMLMKREIYEYLANIS
mgnify:CR=1 FL=1